MVARPQLHTRLQSLLRPDAVDDYTLIVGAHGTGKSTAVRKAAREASAAGPNGVVYTTVDDGSAFSAQLTTLLEEAPAAAAGRKHEPTTSWRLLAPDLRKAAMEFRNQHGRPMTLVIDKRAEAPAGEPGLPQHSAGLREGGGGRWQPARRLRQQRFHCTDPHESPLCVVALLASGDR